MALIPAGNRLTEHSLKGNNCREERRKRAENKETHPEGAVVARASCGEERATHDADREPAGAAWWLRSRRLHIIVTCEGAGRTSFAVEVVEGRGIRARIRRWGEDRECWWIRGGGGTWTDGLDLMNVDGRCRSVEGKTRGDILPFQH
jgi:hypothetical protein